MRLLGWVSTLNTRAVPLTLTHTCSPSPSHGRWLGAGASDKGRTRTGFN